ncbi:virulence factor Mce family protein [Mycobacterium branderi]|uniref:MCE family protein n=1 Tax=Mycobacterium branderi TaxID=43348 RepID=A0A7I7W8I3_9MYCO|nr:MlaD family protein [Mycobacterium branderi]MCV7236068.1 MCE family protein [Mycobacterium branderi]ORA32750.1 MCE family protein [Mycobacterium branderi]BBZ12128.1 mammalian cell entry protein [Mycobacterium branderi]
MLTRFIRYQLIVFAILTVAALVALGWYYLRIPSMIGIGQYTLTADLPASGGLYRTSNVTYRGIQIGKVTKVQPTVNGARATLSIDKRYRIPIDATANVHSVSAVGEQYLDLVSTGNPGKFFSPGQTITKGTVPSEIGPALDAANRGLSVLPKNKIASLLDETAQAVGGMGPALQRLVDSTQTVVGDFKNNLSDVNDIIANSAPIIDSQVTSGDSIERWSHNLNVLTAQVAQNDTSLQRILSKAPPTADQVAEVFSDVREALPQTVANLEIVADMLKRYNKGLEQLLVFLPEIGSVAQSAIASAPGSVLMDFNLSLNNPPPCLTGFLPASEWRSPADTSTAPLPTGTYCKIPQDTPANVVRGARNLPCVDVPGKRAATPRECRDPKPYVPLGTNPWYGDPNQIRNCPAPGARCDQPVNPGEVIPAPSVNNGLNPLQADKVPGTPPPVNDPLSRPGSGTVQCNGQQPNPCVYTPSSPAAVYLPSSGEVVGPDGVKYNLENSSDIGDDGWKQMLAPAPAR